MKYQAVLFDMDGTVLSTLDDITNAVNHTLQTFSYPAVEKSRVCAGTGNGSRHLLKYCTPESVDEETIDKILEYYMGYYNSHCRIETKPYDGIIPLMQKLKAEGVKLAVVSNKLDPAVKELAAEFFSGMLESAVGESDAVRRKPEPDTVLAAAEMMGVPVSACVYVGDSEVDVMTAANAGMDCIGVSWGFRERKVLEDAGAIMIADTMEQLAAFLE